MRNSKPKNRDQSKPLKQAQILLKTSQKLTVRDLSQNGEGIAVSSDVAELKGSFFIEDALPGEDVELLGSQITKKQKIYRVKGATRLTTSPKRRKVPCKHFTVCGGCACQHLAYEAQVALKEKHVFETLKRIGGLSLENVCQPIITSEQEFFYRNNVQYQAQLKTKLPLNEQSLDEFTDSLSATTLALGFYNDKSHSLVEINRCLLAEPALEQLKNLWLAFIQQNNFSLTQLEQISQVRVRKGEELLFNLCLNSPKKENVKFWLNKVGDFVNYAQLELVTTENIDKPLPSICAYVQTGDTVYPATQLKTISQHLGEIVYQLDASSFFQVNSKTAEKLVNAVCQWVKDYLRDLFERERPAHYKVLDLYCGIGTFALQIYNHLKQLSSLTDTELTIEGIELNPRAIELAKQNASLNSIPVKFAVASAENLSATTLKGYQLVIVDPPRRGLTPQLCKQLLAAHQGILVYVSCNPATLARDLKILTEGFQVELVQPVDLFPQTMHVETVCLMTRVR